MSFEPIHQERRKLRHPLSKAGWTRANYNAQVKRLKKASRRPNPKKRSSSGQRPDGSYKVYGPGEEPILWSPPVGKYQLRKPKGRFTYSTHRGGARNKPISVLVSKVWNTIPASQRKVKMRECITPMGLKLILKPMAKLTHIQRMIVTLERTYRIYVRAGIYVRYPNFLGGPIHKWIGLMSRILLKASATNVTLASPT